MSCVKSNKLSVHFITNRYVPEGNMTACGTDYLSKSWVSRSYILVYSIFVYYLPLLLIIYSYFFIVQVRHKVKIGILTKKSTIDLYEILTNPFRPLGRSSSRKGNEGTSQENERGFPAII